MANISQQTMAGWYKNFLLLNAATNVGVSSTPVYLQDGNGGAIPLAVSKTGLQVSGAAKLHFRDTGVYIHSSGTNVLKLAGTNIKLYGTVSITGKTTGVSAELVSGLTASVIRTTNLTTTGTATIGTCSATTLKGTNVEVTGTVSCASIKGTIDYTNSTGKSIKMGALPINLYNDTTVIDANVSGLHIRYAGDAAADTIKFTSASMIPFTNEAYNLGTGTRGFKNVYSASATFTTANITTANLTGGTFTAIGAIGASKLTVSTVSMKRELKLNTCSMYFDTAKRFSAKYSAAASAIALYTPGTYSVYFKSNNTIYPSTTNVIDLGITGNRWKAVYCTSQ